MEAVQNNDDPKMPSAEARKFIQDSCGAKWETVDLSPEGVKALREENATVSKESWAQYLASSGPQDDGFDVKEITTREETLGSVAVQWVLPMKVSTSLAERGEPSRLDEGGAVILYAFGGAFLVGSPEDDFSMTSRLAAFTGLPICVPRYRLAPENPFPAGRDDLLVCYAALLKADLSRRIVLVGESAGGNLALRLTLDAMKPDPMLSCTPPVALVLMSPWIDLTHSGDSHKTLQNHDPTLSVDHFLHPAAGAYVGVDPAGGNTEEESSADDVMKRLAAPQVSPLLDTFPQPSGASSGVHFPPTFISSGTRDLLLSDCVRLATKIRRAGAAKVELHVAEGLFHVYEWYPQFAESAESLKTIADFINIHS